MTYECEKIKAFTVEREERPKPRRRKGGQSYVGHRNIVDKCDFSCMFLLLLYLVNGLTEANKNTQTNRHTRQERDTFVFSM